jgi:hypothetical protein
LTLDAEHKPVIMNQEKETSLMILRVERNGLGNNNNWQSNQIKDNNFQRTDFFS